jgi:hypothetical protein
MEAIDVTVLDVMKDRFNEMNVEFLLFPENRIIKFKSLAGLYNFVCKEVEFWDACTQGTRVSDIRNYFHEVKNLLFNAMNMNDENNAINFLNQAIDRIKINQYPAIFSTTEMGGQIKKMYEFSPNRAEGFASFLIEKPGYGYIAQGNFSDKEYVTGVLHAFALENPEVTLSLTEEERQSRIESIRSLHESVNQSVVELSDETTRVREISKVEATHINELKTTFIEEKEQLLSESKQKIKELEELYGEKLRLSAPAQYWEDTRKSYWKTGAIWTTLTITWTGIFLWVIKVLVFSIQKQEALSKAGGSSNSISFDSIKFGILLTVFISVGIFLINFFIKLATSAFHLARDANERLQLTHLYLSLLNEQAVTVEERSIVLQSLFSRADTGLLKGDSSPTIPDNGLMGQVLKVTGK